MNTLGKIDERSRTLDKPINCNPTHRLLSSQANALSESEFDPCVGASNDASCSPHNQMKGLSMGFASRSL